MRAKYADQMNGYNMAEQSAIRSGLVRERECTDAFCAVAFVVFFLAFFGILIYSLVEGNPLRSMSGVDGDLRVCG